MDLKQKVLSSLRKFLPPRAKESGGRDDVVDEHYIPVLGLDIEDYIRRGDISGIHHLIRYLWALKVIPEFPVRTILDIASGSGYGSYMIAKHFPHIQVTGIDYDRNAVDQALKHYSLPNLKYQFGDAVQWEETIGKTVFDCITSFDTIEHVLHREVMMQNIVEHLDIRGFLLLSTPCGHIKTVFQPEWQHHKIEYSAPALYDFLKRYFKDLLIPDDRSLPHLDVFELLNKRYPCYFLRLNPVMCRGPIVIRNPFI